MSEPALISSPPDRLGAREKGAGRSRRHCCFSGRRSRRHEASLPQGHGLGPCFRRSPREQCDELYKQTYAAFMACAAVGFVLTAPDWFRLGAPILGFIVGAFPVSPSSRKRHLA